MKNKKTRPGKPVDISGINPKLLNEWIRKNKVRWAAVKCQALIALHEGVSVTEVCNIFNVTRESLRLWRDRLKEEGIDGFVKYSKGKKSNLTTEVKNYLQKVIRADPIEQGYNGKKWTGKLVCKYLKDHRDIEISVRTAQNWLIKTGIRKTKRQKL
jgi:transposase